MMLSDTFDMSEVLKAASPQTVGDVAALLALAASSAVIFYKPWARPNPNRHVFFEKPQSKNGNSQGRHKKSRNIATLLEESNKDAVIFWGSQSGTAEAFAARLARDCRLRFGLQAISADLSDYDADTIAAIPASKPVIFIISTFGEGDPPDNAADLWKHLQSRTPQPLENLNYAALGLGNSNYQHYNRVIDVVTTAIDNAGARMILPLAKADDAEGNTEAQFSQWKESLLVALKYRLKLEEREPVYLPGLRVDQDDSLDVIDLHTGAPVQKRVASTSLAVSLPIRNAHELFHDSARNCIHLDFDLTEVPGMSYKTGDHLVVWPVNPDDEVERLLRLLGLTNSRSVPLSIKSLDSTIKVPVPTPTTPEVLFRHYLEICAAVSLDTIDALVQFAPSPSVKSFLDILVKDKAKHAAFSQKHYLTLGRLLEFSVQSQGLQENGAWATIPLAFIIETLSASHPRLYSISSSSIISPKVASVTALVVKTALPGTPSESIHGVASNYLHSASLLANSQTPMSQLSHYIHRDPDPRLHVAVRKSTFRPPTSPTTVIMVAAGTGVAPFRGFLLERARLHAMGRPVGRTLLFFGCRSPEEDFIYQKELEEAAASLPGAEIIPVYSRKNYVGKPGRGYVQDAVKARGEELGALILDESARVYVCGRAAMSREVAATLKACASSARGWSEAERDEWWVRWRRMGGFLEDVWG
ncbi:NADPH cytochrome p450 reductase [Dactylonectria macrodidyma]|uniref:NADPH cytochrome p450 reductase n=1 Tax=Dactylonectria macrodidyma TaxID=307937 RepID=A0A9P9JFG6_9HYPO|nr:NADPH cytochrome p450 reductase [Dactylonectria macrodidyma]